MEGDQQEMDGAEVHYDLREGKQKETAEFNEASVPVASIAERSKEKKCAKVNGKCPDGCIELIGEEYFPIYIRPDTAIFAHSESGEILGPQGEGTLGIVLYGGNPPGVNPENCRLRVENALRIPRLLQSDKLLNFHISEISFYEGLQAAAFPNATGLLGAAFFHTLNTPIAITKLPGHQTADPAYIAFYLSTRSKYRVGLVTQKDAWPNTLKSWILNMELGEIKNISEEEVERACAKFFNDISAKLTDINSVEFKGVLFYPDRDLGEALGVGENGEDDYFLTRENLEAHYAGKETSGWWFNVPVAGYAWMSADLQRLLVGFVDSEARESDGGVKSFDSWNLGHWFEMAKTLASGIKTLHERGCIHGDLRPANVMTDVYADTSLRPESFRWIDIGLGYGHVDGVQISSADNGTIASPRPLGGGRVTPFYSPERIEAIEYEDADLIELRWIELPEEGQGTRKGTRWLELQFFWKERTSDGENRPLQLLDKEKRPVRDLGGLQGGDRVQIREFLFNVVEVRQSSLIVDEVFEVVLERLLIRKTNKKLDDLVSRLGSASISRYQIFKQWGQASDIFGFGATILHIFYIRGLHVFNSTLKMGEEDEGERTGASFPNRTKRDSTFEDIIAQLQSQSFLDTFLYYLAKNNLEERSYLYKNLQKEKEMRNQRRRTSFRNFSEVILWIDSSFEFIFYGVDADPGLFTNLIYFCLSCFWRKEDLVRKGDRAGESGSNWETNWPGYSSAGTDKPHFFTPFCNDRLFQKEAGRRDAPITALMYNLDKILAYIHTENLDERGLEVERQKRPEMAGKPWLQRIIYFQEKITKFEGELRLLRDTHHRARAEVEKFSGKKQGKRFDHSMVGGYQPQRVDLFVDDISRLYPKRDQDLAQGVTKDPPQEEQSKNDSPQIDHIQKKP